MLYNKSERLSLQYYNIVLITIRTQNKVEIKVNIVFANLQGIFKYSHTISDT